MTSSTRDAINRANSLHSTGPRTVESKERAAMNALKHGLTGQRLILQPEEHEAYRRLSKSLNAELRPKTTMEQQLVQKIIDTHMRLNRAAALDNNMLNFGLMENLTDAVHHEDTEIAHSQARAFITQQLSFDKLSRYEGRLSRQLIAYTKELERLQAVRRKNEQAYADRRVNEGRASLGSRHITGIRPATQTAAATPVSPSLASFGNVSLLNNPAPDRQPETNSAPPPETPLAA